MPQAVAAAAHHHAHAGEHLAGELELGRAVGAERHDGEQSRSAHAVSTGSISGTRTMGSPVARAQRPVNPAHVVAVLIGARQRRLAARARAPSPALALEQAVEAARHPQLHPAQERLGAGAAPAAPRRGLSRRRGHCRAPRRAGGWRR